MQVIGLRFLHNRELGPGSLKNVNVIILRSQGVTKGNEKYRQGLRK